MKRSIPHTRLFRMFEKQLAILRQKHLAILRPLGLSLGLLLLGAASFAQDDAIGKFFGKYLDDSRFSVVSISPKMFRLLSGANWDSVSPDVRQTITKLQSLRILSTETTPAQFYKEASSLIDRKQYEELITVHGKDGEFHFMIKEDGNVIRELLMVAMDHDGFTVMSFVGDIDLDRMARLSSSMHLKGMENLRDIKRKPDHPQKP